MRLSRRRGQPILGVNLTPLIDIVFLLIIFFITASQITPLVNFPVRLPEVFDRADAPRLVRATINIDRDGSYVVAGNSLTLDQVLEWLRNVAAESRDQQSELQVLVRSDRRARSASVNQLLPKLTAEGISTVQFGVQGLGGTGGIGVE
jgi:biopolymer transport protein ExbD